MQKHGNVSQLESLVHSIWKNVMITVVILIMMGIMFFVPRAACALDVWLLNFQSAYVKGAYLLLFVVGMEIYSYAAINVLVMAKEKHYALMPVRIIAIAFIVLTGMMSFVLFLRASAISFFPEEKMFVGSFDQIFLFFVVMLVSVICILLSAGRWSKKVFDL